MKRMGSKSRLSRYIVVLLLLISLVAGPVALAGEGDLVQEVKTYLRLFYVDPLPEAALQADTVDQVLEALKDPYTDYLPPEDYQHFMETVSGRYSGVGMSLEQKEAGVVVVTVFPDSPAQKAGLASGDLIVGVNGEDVQGKTVEQVSALIRGEAGTKVRIAFVRNGQRFEVEVTRAVIHLPSTSWKVLEGDIAYLKLSDFYEEAPQQVEQALKELKGEGVKGLVLDLRDNPGGLLQSAVTIGGYFIPGVPIVTVVSRQGEEEVIRTPKYEPLGLPVVVLVNRGTASAAEILAGAIQDYSFAHLVGTRTFGKGTVQSLIELSNGGVLKLTTARYLTPLGREVNGHGLEPDFVIEDPEQQLVVAREFVAWERPHLIQVLLGQGEVRVDGRKVAVNPSPFIAGGRTYVPLDFFAAAMGAKVEWQSGAQKAVLHYGPLNVELPAGKQEIRVGDRVSQTDAGIILQGVQVFVPLRAVSEAFGATVEWNAASRTAEIRP